MIPHLLILAIYIAICVFLFETIRKDKNREFEFPTKALGAIVVLAFVVRIAFALSGYSFSYDISCFKAWSDYTVTYGFNDLYWQELFLDYPPGYMYVLFILRNIASFFGIPLNSDLYTMVIKLPAIIVDFGCAFLLYKIAKENLSEGFSRFLVAVFLLCPAVVYNSSVWGQIDSFFVFFIALAIYFAYKNKTAFAAVSYAYALLIKPQALLFGPIFLFYIIERKSVKEFFKAAGAGLLTIYLLVLPFCQHFLGLSWLIDLYKNTLGSVSYFTVNAYNLYTVLGLNWRSLDDFRGAESINVIVITALVVFIGFAFLRIKDKSKFFYLSYFIMLAIFCFTTMMHERYIYPAILIGLLAFAVSKNRSIFYLVLILGAVNYLNCVAVMGSYFDGYATSEAFPITLALVTLTCFGVSLWLLVRWLKRDGAFNLTKGQKEFAAVALITGLYSIFALFNLGSKVAPQSYFLSGSDNMEFEISFKEPTAVSGVYTFGGIGDSSNGEAVKKESSNFDIYYATEDGDYNHLISLEGKSVFQWYKESCDIVASKIKLVAKSPNEVLNEIIFVDKNGQPIEIGILSYNNLSQYPATNALDEIDTLPDDLSYYNSAYFDEIYHARTAYEQLHGYSIYETTHPPLGKILISIGVAIFGMTPFGWRIVGAICGVIMLPIFYILAKQLFRKIFPALAVTSLLAVDFMHLTQTRISTVDTYVVLFTMLTFLFMIYYHKQKFTQSLKKQFIYLGLSGFFMGCAVATKWNGAYAMIGLAIFFLVDLFFKYRNSDKDYKCKLRVLKILAFCVFAFISVPVVVYSLSFIPVIHADSLGGYISELWRYQVNMFDYHTNLDAEHFFSSLWYTWPFTIKPIWYSVTMLANNMVSTISAFGNPLIWWVTPFAITCTMAMAIKEKQKSIWLIILGFISSVLPWVFVTRLSFIYHYFPSVIFGILAIGFVINYIATKYPRSKKYVMIYIAACAVIFLIFLPVTTGIAAPKGYIEMLELLPNWFFVN